MTTTTSRRHRLRPPSTSPPSQTNFPDGREDKSSQVVLVRELERGKIPKLPMPGRSLDTTWMTLILGTGLVTSTDFRQALMRVGKVTGFAHYVLGTNEFTHSISAQRVRVDLALASPRDLGFGEGTSPDCMCKRAEECGLERCTPEAGAQLRIQLRTAHLKKLPVGTTLYVGMTPINDATTGVGAVFEIRRNTLDRPLLDTCRGVPPGFFGPDYIFVWFRRPQVTI